MKAEIFKRMTVRRQAASAAALGLALVGGIAWAGEFNPLGDGSSTNNADLLRDPTTGCENCDPMPPHEWGEPPVKLDWSLSFRRAYVRDATGDHYEALIVPSVTFAHDFLRGSVSLKADAEISKPSTGEYRLNTLDLAIAGEYQLNADTRLSGDATLALEQLSADEAQEISGGVSGTVEHDFGPLTVALRGNGARSVYGPTTIDNSWQNNWRAGGGLRVGYKVTPILTAFIDGSASYQFYDGISPDYGTKLDASDYAGRVGISAKWNEVLEGEVSVGMGIRKFTEAPVADATTNLYDASLTFRPDETVTLRAGFATTVDAPGPDSAGAARVEYAATGDLSYQVNPWLTLRASAEYSHSTLTDTTDTETEYGFGTGADYLLNENVSLTADYAYANTIAPPDPADEEHRVTLGVTLKR